MSEEIKYIESRAQGIAKYSDKLRASIKSIDEMFTPFFEDAGISVKDDEFEYTTRHGTKFNLAIAKSYPGHWGIYLDNGYYEDMLWIGDASREALKMATKRILPLLEKYSKVLEQKEIEYKEIAEKTEAMVEAVKGL